MPQRNIILFVNSVFKETIESVRRYSRKTKEKFKIAVVVDSKNQAQQKKLAGLDVDIIISCDLSRSWKIEQALLPYKDELLAFTCRGEAHINTFAKIIPNVPYLRTPTAESLFWATDKITMRERMRVYDKKIIPRFTIVSKTNKESIQKIKSKVGFPLVIKPAGLAASLLVSICFHEEELEETLRRVFRKIHTLYKENKRSAEPKVLVEQFMEGEMYSIDVYVSARGKVYFCPMVHVKTGRTIGFDDFFGYQQMTPTLLKKSSIEEAEGVAQKAVYALALRSTTVHIELMKTEEGWKIIELGPRVGGFRPRLYQLSYGIDHSLNDVLIRIPKKPIIPKKVNGYSVALKFFAKDEGRLNELKGIKKIKKLKSFVGIEVNKKLGEQCRYAKHGGRSVCNLFMFNPSRSDLLADIRRAEKFLVIKTVKRVAV
ncbi:MAG: ATP-grasp domain-containing protein [Patescibacteria group bacterium]